MERVRTVTDIHGPLANVALKLVATTAAAEVTGA